MAEKVCPNCGFPLGDDDRDICPECGFIFSSNQSFNSAPIATPPTNQPTAFSTDWAQYTYECGVIAWKAFKKSFCFTGRASRREYWSLAITLYSAAFIWERVSTSADIFNSPLYLLILIPLLSAGVRRVHDCGKNGWWSVCPFACFFLFLKKSDESINKYGNPNPAKDLL